MKEMNETFNERYTSSVDLPVENWRRTAMEFVEFIRTPMVDGVTLYRPNNMPVEGTLCVTGHHLILSSRKDNKEELWVILLL